MKKISLLIIALFPLLSMAQDHPFIGYKFIPGDTAWYSTQLITTTNVSITGGNTTKTRMEQAVYHHQYTTSHSDSGVVMVIVYDSLHIKYGGDSAQIEYNSNNPADSASAYNMMVYPLKSMLGHPLTVYIGASGKIDSIEGIDAMVDQASRKLGRSSQIEELKQTLNAPMIGNLLNQSLGNLPNKTMSMDSPTKFTRARMVGRTQFLDDVVTSLLKVSGDTAWLNREVYTHIASPTIMYGGKRCVIDSTWGTGNQILRYDIAHGVVLESNERFSNYLRAGISGTDKSLIQTNQLAAVVEMTHYATKSEGKQKKKKK